ncbi:Endonuclease/exonuclease/phosphatase [Spinellus fusiger]|nr:Endonuclease/exonuclease/phosphatase [Spinellus fusiger]
MVLAHFPNTRASVEDTLLYPEGAPLLGNESQESLLLHPPNTHSSILPFLSRPCSQARQLQKRCLLTTPPHPLYGCKVAVLIVFGSVLSLAVFLSLYSIPAPLPAPLLPDKVTNTSARFLTLNIFMRPPGIKNNFSDYKSERLDYIIHSILPRYDIIAMQEAFAFANHRMDTLLQQARSLGFNYYLTTPHHPPWAFTVDGGLLLLSRFPIRQSNVLEFPRGLHSDWLASKGVLHALVELNATRHMHLYTSHTQASYIKKGGLDPQDTLMRYSQFHLIHQFIKNTASNDAHPILLAGDLNVNAIDPVVPNGNSTAYNAMMVILSGRGVQTDPAVPTLTWEEDWQLEWRDKGYETFHAHPVTFGDVKIVNNRTVAAEKVLTNTDQWKTQQSLDRLLWVERNALLQVQNVKVQKFHVRNTTTTTVHFTQISDHYGMSCDLHV